MHTKAGSIVVGVDDSSAATQALRWATDQAVAEHRPLTLVHTVHAVTPQWMDSATVYPREAREALRSEGQQVLDHARAEVERRAPDVEVHEVFAFADPRETLLELSADAAMVVLGSRGRGRLRSLLLGSVSVAVVRHALCPVVVHRPGNRGVVRHGIVVGADATEGSRGVIEFAYREASLRDLPLTVLHCFWDMQVATTAAYLVSEGPSIDTESEKMLLSESLAGMAEKYPDVTVHTELARGMPDHALVRIGERMDLIVVGTHLVGPASQFMFGSMAVSVVEHATCPVAVVPLPKEAD